MEPRKLHIPHIFATKSQYPCTKLEDYDRAVLINLKIDKYSIEAIAYNSQLAFEAGYLSDRSVQYADDDVWAFIIGSLTWEGHVFLDRIRHVRGGARLKRRPGTGAALVAETVGTISSAIIMAAAEGATNSFLKQYDLQ